MKQKTLILAVMFVLLTTIFAMSDDGESKPQVVKEEVKQASEVTVSNEKSAKTATIAELEGYALDNVWLDQEKEIDIAEYEQTKIDFVNKAKKMGIKNEKSIRVKYWNFRINVNELDYLRELGADTLKHRAFDNMTLLDHALDAQVVIIGTIENKEFSTGILKTTYEIKVEEVLIGNDLYKDFPKTVYTKFADKITSNTIYADGWPKDHILGDKYLFFLNRCYIDSYARQNKKRGKLDFMPSKDANEANVFAINKSFDITNLDRYKTNYKYREKKDFDFEELKDKIRKIGKINDKANFFNRSYK